jgi:hypothetical protein
MIININTIISCKLICLSKHGLDVENDDLIQENIYLQDTSLFMNKYLGCKVRTFS